MGNTYRKGLLLSLGSVIQTQVDLYTVIPTASTTSGMNRLCPEHKLKLSQVHQCGGEGTAHFVTEFILGQPNGSGGYLIPETPKPDLPATDVLTLTPVPAKELADNTVPGNSRFYLAPTHPTATEPWQVIYNLLDKGKTALVTKGSLRRGSHEKLWRIEVFRESLVLTEVTYPDTINAAPEIEHQKVSREITSLVDQFVSGLMSSWDKVDVTNTGRQRMDEWLATASVVENVQVTDTNVEAANSLQAALKAAVENTK